MDSSQEESTENNQHVDTTLFNGNNTSSSLQQTKSQQQQRRFDSDLLERFGRWLLEIPRNDVLALKETSEYTDFCKAFERLTQAHCTLVNQNAAAPSKNYVLQQTFRPFSNWMVDDVLYKIFEFLSCWSLVQTSLTCSRFYTLAKQFANQQTLSLQQQRQLNNNVFQLLRAKEQMDGTLVLEEGHLNASVVPVPMLGLGRRVQVTNAGDVEYNGVYYCTGTNGNGFVFTKPRIPTRRYCTVPNNNNNSSPSQEPGRLLQCIISKRFSNETILWYMSKEEVAQGTLDLSQVFTFWSKLMVIGDTTEDNCRYPSQTSILSRNGDPAWQPLNSVRLLQPPIVELLD